MNQENNPNDRSLDLSLGIGPQEQDPIEEQGQFMQLLRSVSDPPPNSQPTLPPPHQMIPSVIHPCNVSGAASVPCPPLGVALPPSPSSYLGSGQHLQPPQASMGGAGALDTPRPAGTRLGRPPARHHARGISSSATTKVAKSVDDKKIVPPYPWATSKPAQIHNLRYLHYKNINVISGKVHCRPCEYIQTLEYNLTEKFRELYQYIYENKEELRHRSPEVWLKPKLTPCRSCENELKPLISDNKEEINWLFLLLGQMLGCCTLEQLRYFCDQISQHRTGSKDRVLYATYLGLCEQLHPCNLFRL